MFSASRLRVARKRRRFNKSRLAEAIGVNLRAITAFEAGEYEPSPANLASIARVLEYPPEFFSGDDLHEPTADTASFRAMTRMSAGIREAALASGAEAILLNEWIEQRFELPESNVLDLADEDPAAAAMSVRRHWGLGERPIKNMIHLLEANGIRVYSLSEDTVDVDAFSLWRDRVPFIFLNTLKSAEHGRFDAAHELGHLVLHRACGPQGRDTEQQANKFASAFLMPQVSVLANAPRFASLNTLIRLKRHWNVSIAALAHRLHAIGLVTDWHYRSLCIQIAQRGWRTVEPDGAPRETSQILAKVFGTLRSEGTSVEEVASQLNVTPAELKRLVFHLVLLDVQGGGKSTSRRQPALRLVKE
ncbi:MAG TPA: ImmA/IrrE family metallo-endopeptidase [Candidatus Sulfotelmatobacter sp.]|nr:ImmA/IrrE family metallo-endopeptidase [Candidatus Sulfotelmatobacter sp.]